MGSISGAPENWYDAGSIEGDVDAFRGNPADPLNLFSGSFGFGTRGGDAARAAKKAGGIYEQYARMAEAKLSPYQNTFDTSGINAPYDMRMAATGALGPEDQQNYYNNYQLSPAAQFQIQQGTRAIDQNSAATGGLMGGNRLKALQEYGQGIAAQDMQQQFQNLGAVGQEGMGRLGFNYGVASDLAGIETGIGSARAEAILAAQQAKSQAQQSTMAAGAGLASGFMQGAGDFAGSYMGGM